MDCFVGPAGPSRNDRKLAGAGVETPAPFFMASGRTGRSGVAALNGAVCWRGAAWHSARNEPNFLAGLSHDPRKNLRIVIHYSLHTPSLRATPLHRGDSN